MTDPKKEVYCTNCTWHGIPASDRCPGCLEMGHFINSPQKPTPAATTTQTTATTA